MAPQTPVGQNSVWPLPTSLSTARRTPFTAGELAVRPALDGWADAG